jgi:hypothetical protein
MLKRMVDSAMRFSCVGERSSPRFSIGSNADRTIFSSLAAQQVFFSVHSETLRQLSIEWQKLILLSLACDCFYFFLASTDVFNESSTVVLLLKA